MVLRHNHSKQSSTSISCLLFVGLLALPSLAAAGQPGFEAPEGPEDSPHVWEGNETEPCAWPSVVMVTGGGGLCTGSLIHPQVVMYAAHCGSQDKVVRFGDSQNSAKTKQVEYCKTYPFYQGSQSNDWAYCVLAEPMLDVPITPVAYGCGFQQHYGNGAEIAIIGFGNNSGDSGAGRKRWGWTTISNATNSRFDVGGFGSHTICSGDSGGPAMIRHDDQSWHVYGIASTKNDNTCSQAKGTHSLAINAAEWIEEDSGIDVTVCHDLQGNWDPTVYCGNFFDGQPALSYGSWNTWCQDATALEWSSECGGPFSDNAESNPPQLNVLVPFDGQIFDAAPAEFDITVNAEDDSGLPVDVQISIQGELLDTVKSENPAVFPNASFPCGEYEIIAYGTDFWGNEGVSEPANFTVECGGGDDGGDGGSGDGDGDPGDGDGDTGPSEDSEGGEGGEEAEGGDTVGDFGDEGFDGGGLSSDEGGCACGVEGPGSKSFGGRGLALVFGLLGLGWLRRRRS